MYKLQRRDHYLTNYRKQTKSLRSGSFLLLAAVLFTALATSCQKYKEGPFISFRSQEKRLTNEWKVKYAENIAKAENVTQQFQDVNYSIKISANDSFRLSFHAPGRSGGLKQRVISGTWHFVDDKKKVKWQFQGRDPYGFIGTKSETSLILKLKKDELWMENQANELELRFKPL